MLDQEKGDHATGEGIMVCDEMGLGKTIQTVAIMAEKSATVHTNCSATDLDFQLHGRNPKMDRSGTKRVHISLQHAARRSRPT